MAEWTTPTSIHSKCGESSPNIATRAKDDDTGTYWRHSSTCYHWIIFDFSQTYTITKIRIYQDLYDSYSRWGMSVGLDVFVSDDPASWGSAVWTGTLNGGDWQESGAFSKNGRYVKLISKTSGSSQLMFEFDGYCEATAGGYIPYPLFSDRAGGIGAHIQGGIGR